MNDIEIARRYVKKAEFARNKGIVFNLTFHQYKRILTAKFCRYTGVKLTTCGSSKVILPNFTTLDRVDNNKGYITGNVVPCCHAYNSFKGILENPSNLITFKMVCRAVNVQKKLQKSGK